MLFSMEEKKWKCFRSNLPDIRLTRGVYDGVVARKWERWTGVSGKAGKKNASSGKVGKKRGKLGELAPAKVIHRGDFSQLENGNGEYLEEEGVHGILMAVITRSFTVAKT